MNAATTAATASATEVLSTAVGDIEVIDSELRLLLAIRRAVREIEGGRRPRENFSARARVTVRGYGRRAAVLLEQISWAMLVICWTIL